MHKHPGIQHRVRKATPIGKVWRSGLVNNYIRKPYGDGWLLIGDAGVHIDPWTGMGLDIHGISAKKMAEAIIKWFEGQKDSFEKFHKWRNEHIKPIYERTVSVSKDLGLMKETSK